MTVNKLVYRFLWYSLIVVAGIPWVPLTIDLARDLLTEGETITLGLDCAAVTEDTWQCTPQEFWTDKHGNRHYYNGTMISAPDLESA